MFCRLNNNEKVCGCSNYKCPWAKLSMEERYILHCIDNAELIAEGQKRKKELDNIIKDLFKVIPD